MIGRARSGLGVGRAPSSGKLSSDGLSGRFRRWRDAGVWDRIVQAIVEAHGRDIALISAAAIAVPPAYGSRRDPAEDPVAWIFVHD
jgi:hypothetical protein